MNRGELLFVADDTWTSKIIRWVTKGEWSHVAIAWKDGLLVEAILSKGVRLWPEIKYFSDPSTRVGVYKVKATKAQIEVAIAFAVANLGKRYDLLGQIGILLKIFCERRGMGWITFWGKNKAQDEGGFWCSELVGYCFEKAGVKLCEADATYLSPQDIADSPLVEKV